MSSPFPGVDPYLESQGLAEDLLASLITYSAAALNEVLPADYAALIGSRVDLVDQPRAEAMKAIPDVLVSRRRVPAADPGPAGRSAGTATIEPVRTVLPREKIEVRSHWIEILRLPGRIPVTMIELLSPTNKTGEGIGKYLRKRRATIRRKLHLVEIDLLLGGERLPMGEPLPPGDYYALVSRADERPESEAYAWTMRDPLPALPIPLVRPDPDVKLDLAAAFAMAYDRGRYSRLIDYSAPPSSVGDAADRAWAGRTAGAARR